MEHSIVQIQKNDLIVGTWDMSKNIGVEHRMLTRTLEKYKEDFESEFGFVASQRQRIANKKGGQIEQYALDEPQAMYLLTLLTNMESVRKFKIWLTKEFFRQRKILNEIETNRKNTEWIERRQSGMIQRKEQTDAIKNFIEYAKSQGSRSADKYYMIITKMENDTLLNIELLKQRFENMRDVISLFELSSLQMADHMIAMALREGMKLEKHYKEIYQDAKLRVETFAISIGKTPLRLMVKEKISSLIIEK